MFKIAVNRNRLYLAPLFVAARLYNNNNNDIILSSFVCAPNYVSNPGNFRPSDAQFISPVIHVHAWNFKLFYPTSAHGDDVSLAPPFSTDSHFHQILRLNDSHFRQNPTFPVFTDSFYSRMKKRCILFEYYWMVMII